jgi:acetyl/propionyl-CoA carboxylase alpha subunit
MNGSPARTARVYLDGIGADLAFSFGGPGRVLRGLDGEVLTFSGGAAFVLSRSPGSSAASVAAADDGVVRAPMPGRVVQIKASVGDHVRAGQAVLVLEAMKMEHALTAPFDAVVAELAVGEGDQVTEGASLAKLEPVT